MGKTVRAVRAVAVGVKAETADRVDLAGRVADRAVVRVAETVPRAPTWRSNAARQKGGRGAALLWGLR